jgi:hypothetical protein
MILVEKASFKIVFFKIIDEAQRSEVLPFLARSKMVDEKQVGLATLVQLSNDCAADESGGSGYQDHSAEISDGVAL